MFKSIAKRIKYQSVIVILLTFATGCYLLRIGNDWSTPAGMWGSGCIGVGIFSVLWSFLSINQREYYEGIISHYKGLLRSQKSISKDWPRNGETLSRKKGKTQFLDEYEDSTGTPEQ